MSKMVEIIKEVAINAVNNNNPLDLVFGSVVSISPLQVNVDQKIILEENHLVLTTLVKDFNGKIIVDHVTENSGVKEPHNHMYKGEKEVEFKFGLKEGEKVIMIKCMGGQKYIILDRIRE